MENDVLHSKRRKAQTAAAVSQLRVGQDPDPVPASDGPNWEILTLLAMQIQEHLDELRSTPGLPTQAQRAIDALDKCAGQLVPVLIEQAKR